MAKNRYEQRTSVKGEYEQTVKNKHGEKINKKNKKEIRFTKLLRYLIGYITDIRYPKYSTGLFYIVLILISTVFMAVRWKKEKTMDISGAFY